jgi:hypothetical protein
MRTIRGRAAQRSTPPALPLASRVRMGAKPGKAARGSCRAFGGETPRQQGQLSLLT